MAESQLSHAEMVLIDAEFRQMTNPAFRDPEQLIDEMWDRLLSRPNLVEGTPQWDKAIEQGKAREIAIINQCKNLKFRIDNIVYKKSPGFFSHPLFPLYMYYYDLFDKGTLPFEGGAATQPAKLMDILGYIRKLHNEKREADQKAQAAKQAHKSAPRTPTK